MEVGEGGGLVEVELGADLDVLPGGVFEGVEVDDLVSGLDAGAGGCGVGGDVVDGGGVGEVLHDLVVGHVDAHHEEEGEDEVGDGAGEGDDGALPAGMVLEFAGIVGEDLVFAGGAHLSGHFDVAAEGEEVEAVVGAVVDEAEEALAEADGEGFHAHAAELGGGEVAELMHEDHDAEDDGEFRKSGERRSGEQRFRPLGAETEFLCAGYDFTGAGAGGLVGG